MDYSGKIITKNPVEPSQTSASGVWTLDQATQAVQGNNWPIAYVPNPISRSLRFNSADSTYLNRTPATAGTSATVWTFSWWQKGVSLAGSTQVVFGAESGGSRDLIRWDGSGSLEFVKASSNVIRIPSAKYRDPSAWYHFIINVSGTTVGVYVNGVQVTAFSASNNPAGNWYIGQAYLHRIGLDPTGGDALNGYLTEVNFIDGQALDPTYFGMTDPRTGAWIPKKYSGTYGTNGFYLNFSDNASTAALGTDYSGNSNTWTTNNFSVTAGSGNDSLTDVPTPWIPYNTTGDVGGVFRGNYCTVNAIYKGSDSVLTNGNLNVRCGDSLTSYSSDHGTIAVSSGKWYYEFIQTNIYSTDPPGRAVGWSLTTHLNTQYPGQTGSWSYVADGTKYVNGGSASAYGASWTTNDVIGVALDLDAGTLTFYKNNVSQGTAATGLTGTFIPCFGRIGNDAGRWIEYNVNFGQRPFAYTPPAGFKSLCTTNLPEPTVLDGGDYFNTVLYTGNGSTQSITGVGFQPNMIWVKDRTAAQWHNITDSVRGAGKEIFTNATNAEETNGGISSFNADGFSLIAWDGANANGDSFVAWNWKESATSGFDIVTYTGDGVAGRTVNHDLGVAPSMIIVKSRNIVDGWLVYSSELGATKYLVLNATSAAGTLTAAWNDTAPTSTVFSVGTNDAVNQNAATYVAYLFAAVPGFSAFGSYTGNGSTDGPFVYTGFRPRYLMVKVYDSAGNSWWIWDSARNPYNETNILLAANASSADTSPYGCDFLSNGFKLRTTTGQLNGSGLNILYAAFAENPFKYSNAR